MTLVPDGALRRHLAAFEDRARKAGWTATSTRHAHRPMGTQV